MKQIEDLERLSWEELEQAAAGERVKSPDGLERRLAETLAAKALSESAPAPRPRILAQAAWAVAAALAFLLIIPVLHSREPKDTFDDPYLAYAEVEKVFRNISDKMSLGVDLAKEVQPTVEKPLVILEKINEQ